MELEHLMEVLWRFFVDGVSRSSVHVAVRVSVLVRLRFDMPLIAVCQPFTLLENSELRETYLTSPGIWEEKEHCPALLSVPPIILRLTYGSSKSRDKV